MDYLPKVNDVLLSEAIGTEVHRAIVNASVFTRRYLHVTSRPGVYCSFTETPEAAGPAGSYKDTIHDLSFRVVISLGFSCVLSS